MEEIICLCEHVKSNHRAKYFDITCIDKEMVVVFHKELIVKIIFDGFYKIYINNVFYYDVDAQDIMNTIDDLFSGKYVFCKIKGIRNYKIKIIPLARYINSNQIICAWSMEKTLK